MTTENKFYEPVDGMTMPRFGAMPTFMRLPHVTDFSQTDIALAGVPWDGGTTNRAGARDQPSFIHSSLAAIATNPDRNVPS